MSNDPRHWSPLHLFNPQEGIVVREPLGQGNGYWVGAPGAYFEPKSNQYFLTYRIRRPRGASRRSRSPRGIDDSWARAPRARARR